MTKKIFTLICIATVLLQSCQEKEPVDAIGNIEGSVYDIETTEAISGVVVRIYDPNSSFQISGGDSVVYLWEIYYYGYPFKQSRRTGNDGKFAFKDLTPGRYYLLFSKSGYNDHFQEVGLVAGQTVSSDVTLTPNPFDGT
jgi:hypothetical protein